MTNVEGMTKSEKNHETDDAFWLDDKTAVVREEPERKPVYHLEERTACFGEAVIDFAKAIPQNATTSRIISQVIGAATSIGANYVEADDSVSKKEFLKSIGTCKKEACETKDFLRMAVRAAPELKTRSPQAVDGSEGTAPDFFEDLAKRKGNDEARMTNVEGNRNAEARIGAAERFFRASSFVIISSFVIRHSSLALRRLSLF
jgi:four helix bundle protein